MAISFRQIPQNWRVPFLRFEIDNSASTQGSTGMYYRCLAIGQKLPDGSVEAGKLVRINNDKQPEEYFAPGSMLASTLKMQRLNNSITELWAIALDDDSTAVAAKGTMTLGGEIQETGILSLYIAGALARVSALQGQTLTALAEEVVAVVNANTALQVTASSEAAVITFTAKNKGQAGNNIDVRINYQEDEEFLPAGLTVSFSGTGTTFGRPNPPWEMAAAVAGNVAFEASNDPALPLRDFILTGIKDAKSGPGMRLSGGLGNPLVENTLAILDDVQYQVITLPYTDTANLQAMDKELRDRFNAMRDLGGLAVVSIHGTHSELGTFGNKFNSEFLSIQHTGPKFKDEENNLLLYDGISTNRTDNGGNAVVQMLITTYKENIIGAADESYLEVNTLLTVLELRYRYSTHMSLAFPKFKIVDDNTRIPSGHKATNPRGIKNETIAWYGMMMDLLLVEDMESFKKSVVVERNQNPRRVDILFATDLANPLDMIAARNQFKK